ncbi:EpsG family protein [Candidatus Pacearchaeota archaeon]|nr:EpsG family protein [Candidatus Pacearchaeota archaeon]
MDKNKFFLGLAVVLLVVISLGTKFMGNTDVYDYTDVAKFFAGEYDAKIRTSHSYLYGFIHYLSIAIFESFWIFKITSLISLLLIVYSVYYISGKDKRALWLMLLSPIIWYMGPWISPIQLASLIFLWGWYFIKKYDKDNKMRNLLYSGALIGLSWAFWDGILFFIPLLLISFFYNKRLTHSIYFFIFILIGSLPRIILDQILFGFFFFTPVRHIMASLALTFLGGFYNQGNLASGLGLILIIIFIPIYGFRIFKREVFKENKKTVIFLILSFLLLIINSQVRFVLLIAPIVILVICKHINKKQFVKQIAVSLVIILLVINPYLIQTKYRLDFGDEGFGGEIGAVALRFDEINFNGSFYEKLIENELVEISTDYPGEVFVVGNTPDSYRLLANVYWGDEVKEFVSIEDYKLGISRKRILVEKEICTKTKIKSRRDICTSWSIGKAFNDDTDYSSIKYGISFENSLEIEDFELVKRYGKLSLFEKS